MTSPIYSHCTETAFQSTLFWNNFLSYSLGTFTFDIPIARPATSTALPAHDEHLLAPPLKCLSQCAITRVKPDFHHQPWLTVTCSSTPTGPCHNNWQCRALPAHLNHTEISVIFKAFLAPVHYHSFIRQGSLNVPTRVFPTCSFFSTAGNSWVSSADSSCGLGGRLTSQPGWHHSSPYRALDVWHVRCPRRTLCTALRCKLLFLPQGLGCPSVHHSLPPPQLRLADLALESETEFPIFFSIHAERTTPPVYESTAPVPVTPIIPTLLLLLPQEPGPCPPPTPAVREGTPFLLPPHPGRRGLASHPRPRARPALTSTRPPPNPGRAGPSPPAQPRPHRFTQGHKDETHAPRILSMLDMAAAAGGSAALAQAEPGEGTENGAAGARPLTRYYRHFRLPATPPRYTQPRRGGAGRTRGAATAFRSRDRGGSAVAVGRLRAGYGRLRLRGCAFRFFPWPSLSRLCQLAPGKGRAGLCSLWAGRAGRLLGGGGRPGLGRLRGDVEEPLSAVGPAVESTNAKHACRGVGRERMGKR